MQHGIALQCQGATRAANPFYPRCAAAKAPRRDVVSRAYDIDVEAEPARAPNTGPTRGGPPPPPPPPPQQQQRTALQPPSRRELLFGLLGMGIGVGGSTAFFNTQYELSEEGAFKGLDALFEDPDFLDAVNEELMYTKMLSEVDDSLEALEGLKTIEAELSNLNEQLSAAIAAEDAAAGAGKP